MTCIVDILGFVHQGVTEPVLCRADDGHEYVVKGKYAGRRALIAEWIAGRLGRLLRLPIPEFELLELHPLLLMYSIKTQEIDHLGRNALFGSRRELNVVEVRPADFGLIDTSLKAKILAFDWWISNPDRNWSEDSGNPNLLWCEETSRLIVMDHNLAFLPDKMETFWDDHVFRNEKISWDQTFCEQMNHDFSIARNELIHIWEELPEEWTEIECGLSYESINQMLQKTIVSYRP